MTVQPLPPSLWAATATPASACPPFAGIRSAEVAIIGAGYTGLAAALHLAEAGREVVVLDAGEPGWGASGRNGGQVVPGGRYDPSALVALLGDDLGPRTLKTVAGAADAVFDLVARHGISCDAERPGWLHAAHDAKALAGLEVRNRDWQAAGADTTMLSADEVARLIGNDRYVGGWLDRRGGSVQPLSYARGLAKSALRAGAVIHGGSPVTGLSRSGNRWRLELPGGRLLASQVILATNGYTDGLWPGLARTVMPIWSFQIATAPLDPDMAAVILPERHPVADTRPMMLYFRKDAANRLVIGGRGPFTDTPKSGDGQHLHRWLRRLFPALPDRPYEFAWNGRVALTADKLPHLHELAPGLHAGLGYNGRGIGMATMMGRLLAERVMGADQDAIDFPITPMRPMALHALHRPMLAASTAWSWLKTAVG